MTLTFICLMAPLTNLSAWKMRICSLLIQTPNQKCRKLRLKQVINVTSEWNFVIKMRYDKSDSNRDGVTLLEGVHELAKAWRWKIWSCPSCHRGDRACRKAGKFKGKWNFRNLGNSMEGEACDMVAPTIVLEKFLGKKVEKLRKCKLATWAGLTAHREGQPGSP